MINALGHRLAAVAWGAIAAGLPLLAATLAVLWQADAVFWFAGQATGAGLAFLGVRVAIYRMGLTARQATAPQQPAPPFFKERDYWRFPRDRGDVAGGQWLPLRAGAALAG